MNQEITGCIPSPLGKLRATFSNNVLVELSFLEERSNQITDDSFEKHPVVSSLIEQLNAYFAGCLQSFNIPITYSGTPFQEAVWRHLETIPFGAVTNYFQHAALVSTCRAARAVGQACNANTLLIIIPCHRVIAKNGEIRGYAGGVWRKRWLLEHEKKYAVK